MGICSLLNIFQEPKWGLGLQNKQLFLDKHGTTRFTNFAVYFDELPLIFHAPNLQALVLSVRYHHRPEQVAMTHPRLVELTNVTPNSFDPDLLYDITIEFRFVDNAVRCTTHVYDVLLYLKARIT